jgi:tetratricopeptide (TPR) repeat protein
MDDPTLGEAYAARRSGNSSAAVEMCRRILADDPGHHGARSLLALCFAEAGHIDKARPLIEDAVAAEPGNWRFLLNLSVLREIEGRVDEAISCARDAAASAPERFEAWGRLGDLCGRQDDFEGAFAALEKAVDLRPEPGLALVLAAAAYETGRFDRAETALDIAVEAAPEGPEALRLRTHLARKRGDWVAFRDLARRWHAADPQSEEARVALAHGHAQQDDFHAAVKTYRPLVAAHPHDAGHAAAFAQYLLWSRDFEEAETFYRRALEIEPGHAAAAAGLARLNVYKGDLGQAAALARAAIEADATNVDAYAQLALAEDGGLSGRDLARLGAVAMDPSVDPEHRAMAWFTLGDAHHRLGDHERAFDAWQRANDLKRDGVAAQVRYNPVATEALVDRLISQFGELPDAQRTSDAAPTPIFIVGMPRSGTTLLDSALAAHAQVSSGGELPGMPALLTRFLEWADSSGWRGAPIPRAIAQQLRTAYLGQFERYRIPDAAFVTDKQPLNFLSVGLIRHLFPRAPVIHIRRNALETGFSIYRNNFTKSWPFSTSLADIGHYYGQYARLMAHWDMLLGDTMATVQYEELVGDFEGELRRLLAFAGLEWDPDCLTYFRQDRIVTTLSSAQVRKPPSKELMRSTAPYASFLQPLRDALERAGMEV